ncbi:MAG: AsmA family protein [Bacteroidales bacterium]|jgi:hypothetical protein|nr:AsmA family protein [Bacteroidales bacterium]
MKISTKKILKITAISLGSLIALLAIVLLVVSRIIVTPEKLTPIVNKQAARFLNCEYSIGRVELTVFSTFPDVGVKIHDLLLLNPVDGSPSDTLANIKECVASLNIRKILKDNTFIINQFYLQDAFANLFISENGKTNFDVFITSDSEDDSEFTINGIDLDKVEIKHTKLLYNDLQNKISAEARDLNTTVKGSMKDNVIDGKAKLNTGQMAFTLLDSSALNVKTNNISLDFKGKMSNLDEIDGEVSLGLSNIFFSQQGAIYADSIDVSLEAPLQASINKRSFSTESAALKVKEYLLKFKGKAAYHENGDIEMDINLESGTWNIEELLTIMPDEFLYLLDGINLTGNMAFTGALQGIYNDTLLPAISVGLKLNESTFSYHELPYNFRDINSEVRLNLADDGKTHLFIHKLEAKTGRSHLSVKGSMEDLMDKQICDIQINGSFNLPEFRPHLPNELVANGNVELSMQGIFTLDQIQKIEIEKIKANGVVKMDDIAVNYQDSLFIRGDFAVIDFSLPPVNRPTSDHILSAKIKSGFLTVSMVDFLDAELKGTKLDMAISNFLDTTQLPFIDCAFNFGNLAVEMDTLSVQSINPSGNIKLTPSDRNGLNPDIRFAFNNSKLQLKNGSYIQGNTDEVTIEGHMVYDDTKKDIILQWSPKLNVSLTNALINVASVPLPVEVPNINFGFTPGKLDIQKSKIILGNSIFNLSGLVTDLDKYLDKTGLLKGNLEFVSDYVDVYQLMDLFNAFGSEVDSTEMTELEDQTDKPFMVPHGIDITLKTGAKKALFKETELFNLIGQLTVKDGILVLEEMGFTSEAAIMQLTAMYRTPRVNHIFMGLDFHLLDINIEKLLEMIPFVDQTIPMLNSFAGNAEFHFAVETYLKSNYEIKNSTLRGALAISGDRLVLLDGKQFSEIAKTLKFSKKTENKIDSLAVELTIFKNEIDVYPFEIAMDKYKAVLDGRHNFKFEKNALGNDTLVTRCEYHISITDTPLPVRLGLKISGDLSDPKFKLEPCKYPHLFRPKRQGSTEKEVLRLKKMISDSLKANVKTDQLPE